MEQNRTQIAKKQMLKALEASLGIVTTALKATDLSRTNYYKWIKEDEEFAAKVEEIESIQQDFIKSKYYECVKDKVPAVVITPNEFSNAFNNLSLLIFVLFCSIFNCFLSCKLFPSFYYYITILFI